MPASSMARRLLSGLLVVATALTAVNAFSQTVPLWIWSDAPSPSTAAAAARTRYVQADRIEVDLLAQLDCHQHYLLIEQPQLDAAALHAHGDALHALVPDGWHAAHFPYVENTMLSTDMQAHIRRTCGARDNVVIRDDATTIHRSHLVLFWYDCDSGETLPLDLERPSMLHWRLGPLNRHAASQLAQQKAKLADVAAQLRGAYPDLLIVFTAAPAAEADHARLARRAVDDSNLPFPGVKAAGIPYSKRSLFAKYVFFNQGTFHGILVVLLAIAIALSGVRILLSVQAPSRFESPQREKAK
ncbi:hypothetical protein CXG81DRAFT_20332 [Caulochytrium protostelioides]|uniref:Protein BIG1 n=1 Tax=Caulochytrium protostelioides TaxID=1555241 RepID=A0A4P9X3K4_9FUNG|nr:hypothetical protein CXG81DRAFT_20332 [Caulochytrium protostelioides]|eukprot:RKO99600.1 hypothetical protein CXG81DRAFT_20332 [Caulochytrium protostelioides]